MAGRRGGPDTLAEATGAPHRALLDVHGVPMLERVVHTLEAVPCIERILISTDAPALLAQFPGLARRIGEGRVTVVQSEPSSPSRSVLRVLEAIPDDAVLVTTADHPLLTPDMVNYFLAHAEAGDGDLAVALVEERRIRAQFPESKRTYLPFRGERFSGANLFAFLAPPARHAAAFWVRAEQFRKQPWRLARAFGLPTLVLFALRLLDLEGAMRRASRAIGARILPVRMPFAEAAVDVDRLGDLELVKALLATRTSP
jgi:CTP:molybdopterin cytidylyltransferase MocA